MTHQPNSVVSPTVIPTGEKQIESNDDAFDIKCSQNRFCSYYIRRCICHGCLFVADISNTTSEKHCDTFIGWMVFSSKEKLLKHKKKSVRKKAPAFLMENMRFNIDSLYCEEGDGSVDI